MPKIEVRKSVDRATANPGDVLHFTIAVANTGAADAVNVDVNDDISRLLDHGSLTATSADGILSGGILRWNNLSIDAGTATTLTFAVRLDVAGWAVGDPAHPSAVWRFELTPEGDGTRLRYWARMGPGPSGLTPAIEKMPDKEEKIIARRLEEWHTNMATTVAGIKGLAEGAAQ